MSIEDEFDRQDPDGPIDDRLEFWVVPLLPPGLLLPAAASGVGPDCRSGRGAMLQVARRLVSGRR